MLIAWPAVEKSIVTLARVEGGFSAAHRGIVMLPDGTRVFAKVGVDDDTKKWARTEVRVYHFLERHAYPFAPKLLSWSDDEASFALEPLLAEDGWNWKDEWTEERLDKTLEAMDALAAIQSEESDKVFLEAGGLNRSNDGWSLLRESKELQQVLLQKLHTAGRSDIADRLNVTKEAKRSARFVFRNDTLVHHDVRADNCPWNAAEQVVRLVDWNWTQIGDKRLDAAPFLVHVHKSGLDITRHHADRLDADALHWIAGFWFRAAATPMWPGGPERLRDMQLQSAIVAIELEASVQPEGHRR